MIVLYVVRDEVSIRILHMVTTIRVFCEWLRHLIKYSLIFNNTQLKNIMIITILILSCIYIFFNVKLILYLGRQIEQKNLSSFYLFALASHLLLKLIKYL